jgi:large subunit ribosomal protein L10
MAKPDKSEAVAELSDAFRTSTAAVLTEYRGLTVAQLKTLRRSLGPTTTYAVVKNTLTKIAARDAGVEGVDHLLAGPSAIAFVKGDPVEAAKGLRDFAKTHPLLIIKGAVMDGRLLSPADVTKLADLESREVLLSKMAGALKGSLSQAVSLFAAPLSQAARAIDALRAKLEAESPAPVAEAVAAGPDVAAEVEAPVVETPETEAVSESEAVSEAEAPAAEAEEEPVAPEAEAEPVPPEAEEEPVAPEAEAEATGAVAEETTEG